MWTYNVTRAILQAGKIEVLPEQIPVDEMQLIRHALLSEPSPKSAYCIKTHEHLMHPLPTRHEVKIICNYRDVRAACLSFMRFMHADFSRSLAAMQSMMELTDYYLNTFTSNLLVVRYEDLTESPAETVRRIAGFLELPLIDRKVADIVNQFSKANVRKKLGEMSDVRVDASGEVKGAKLQSKFTSVPNLDGTYRVYDKSTAFQSNHITSKSDDEWRTFFNAEQLQQMNEIAKTWLERHGYAI